MTDQQPTKPTRAVNGKEAQMHAAQETYAAQKLDTEIHLALDPYSQKNAGLPVKPALDKKKIDGLLKDVIAKSAQVSVDQSDNHHPVPAMWAIKGALDVLAEHNITTADPVLGKDLGTLQATYNNVLKTAPKDWQKAYTGKH